MSIGEGARPGYVDLDPHAAGGLAGRMRRAGVHLRAHMMFALVLLVMLIGAAICLRDGIGWIGKPFPGFLYYEFPGVGSYANYEWPAMQAGIRYRDVILEIDGQAISSGRDIERVVRRSAPGQILRYLIYRRGEPFTVEVPVAVFGVNDFLQSFALPFTVGLIFWVLAVAVYLLKPDISTAWAFFLLCLFLGAYSVTGFQVQSHPHPPWYYITAVCMSFMPAAALHLSLLFPERTPWVERWPWIQLIPYLFALALTLYHLLDVVSLSRPHLGGREIAGLSAHMLKTVQFTRFFTVLAALVLLGAIGYTFFRPHSIIAKQRARVVLLGATVAFLPATLAMGVAALTKLFIPLNFLNLPVLVFPAAIGYAIAHHNLFDVDVYAKRAVGYGIMTAIVGMAYFSLQTIMTTAVSAVFGAATEKLYPFVFALLVVFLFNPVSRKVQESVDRVFFRRRFDYKQTVSSVSDALTSMLNLVQITTQVVHTIRKEMFIDTVGILVLEPRTRTCETFFASDEAKNVSGNVRDVPVGYDDPLLALVREERKLITKYEIQEEARYRDARERCLRQFFEMQASMVIPLVYQGQVTGVLAVGDKKSGQFYTREDVDLLTTMANQAAVAVQNAKAHEEVVRYAEELEASLRRIQILESIKTNLGKFVPKTVKELIEESPEAPSFDKRETDVSVVFADITGYTRLSAQLELDQVNRLVERYFGAFLDEILKYGGDVNETAGDGLMVIFRDPDASRHARAAVLAALGIHRRAGEINDELRGQFEPITMHIGVNSGVASVGATKIEGAAGTRWTFTATGPTTNIAARLSALGEGGKVVISEETRRRLSEGFDVEDLGLHSLKNVALPVQVYGVKSHREEPEAASASIESRVHPRRPVSWPVRLWIGDEAFDARAVDAGAYGLLLSEVPTSRLEVGRSYRLEVHTIDDGPAISCTAEVRTITAGGVGMLTREALPLG